MNEPITKLIEFLDNYTRGLDTTNSIIMGGPASKYNELIQAVKEALNSSNEDWKLIRTAIAYGMDHKSFTQEERNKLDEILKARAVNETNN